MSRTISFRRLVARLDSLGFAASESKGYHLLFQNSDGSLLIFLRELATEDMVHPFDLIRVRHTLVYGGIVKDEDFDSHFFIKKGDSLIWTEPGTGREIAVTAAAGESDGLVVLDLEGTLTPCPIDQLRKKAWSVAAGRRSADPS